jgi:signal transduction histidine kinase
MLRNMKLGTKLLAVILPPLLVLVAVAGIGAKDRLDEASNARDAENYIELAAATSAMITTLQWERTLSLYVLATGEGQEFLEERRARSDAEIGRFTAISDTIVASGDAAMSPLIADSVQRIRELGPFRDSVDRGTADEWIVQRSFERMIDDHLVVVSEVSNTVPVVEVAADLASYSALVRARESAARTASAITIALAQGEFDREGRVWRAYRDAEAGQERYLSLFYDISPLDLSAQLRGALSTPDATRADDLRLRILTEVAATINFLGDGTAVGDPVALDYDTAEWVDRAETRLNAMSRVGDGILADVTSYVTGVRTDAEQAALLFLLVTAAAVLISAILAVVVARRVTKPLRELTVAADRLSAEQLPALVERLRSPTADAGTVSLEPIAMTRNDEIGHLADAFDAIQRVTVEVAEEQSNLLRKGIGDIFVNLARRNQTLLDRQIEFIDQLESSEEDPDVLENLFKLDHLATRMRRNAESLLVLAGVETGHRRSRPVPLADVVRVAIGEVEDFARLSLLSLDDATVSGTAAMDVAHLLSELMENATSFSPPETNVEILGHRSKDGGYVISISDQGIGMSEEQFAEANRLLAEPPLVGLTLSRSLGFTVVGRLAARFNINVRLTASPAGGVTALVTLPETVLQNAQISVEPDRTPAAAPPAAQPAAPVAEVAPEPVSEAPLLDLEPAFEAPVAEPPAVEPPAPDLPRPAAPAPDWVAPAPASSSLASAVPEGAAFDAGLAALMGEEAPSNEEPSVTSEPAESAPSLFSDASMGAGEPPAAEVAEPDVTSAGLVRRVPRAYSPGDPGVERQGSDSATSVAASQRSPEEVRAMLSRYRTGLQRASQSGDGPGSSGSGSDGTN